MDVIAPGKSGFHAVCDLAHYGGLRGMEEGKLPVSRCSEIKQLFRNQPDLYLQAVKKPAATSEVAAGMVVKRCCAEA